VAIDPTSARAYTELGNALQYQGQLSGAVASFRRVAKLAPKAAVAHYNLGNALWAQGDLPAAAARYRRVLEINPKHAEAHCNLGHVLLRQGRPRAALPSFQTGHDLGSQRGWAYPSDQWVERCKRFIELDDRLPAILAGKGPPADAAERLELAELCSYKGLHVSSVRLAAEAFDADAKLAANFRATYRYRAACSAAQAGCGQGEEAARLDEAGRARLRQKALKWLRDDLAWVTGRLEACAPEEHLRLLTSLRMWQVHPPLAVVRDAGPLATLPAAERAAWEKLWAEVGAVLSKGDAK
jgi:tetratricopeptide (TPR) repeat protein